MPITTPVLSLLPRFSAGFYPILKKKKKKKKMARLYPLHFLLSILGLTVAGQEAAKLLNLHEPTNHFILESLSHSTSPPPIAVSVSEADLPVVSSSVLLAESWLRSHVLAHFPSSNFTTILVGKGVLCSMKFEPKWGFVLPSVKNLYYSLVRWGLVREIRVSVAFSSECLGHHSSSSRFRDDLAENLLKPLLSFLQDSNSTYSINPLLYSSSSSSENTNLVFSAHQTALERLGFSQLKDIRLIKEEKPIIRKLTSLTSPPYPEKPKPIGFPAPANVAESPIPLPPQFASAPDGSFFFVPDASPSEVPANPPDVFSAPPPPCVAVPAMVPVPAVVPAPRAGREEKGGLWCVAKPTVPAETLQEAIDYACGEGGADCDEIKPHGSCYDPDNVVAHASFAFNSYWQKTKDTGGSCNFGGTAILINSDPSFLHCQFALS